MQFIQAKHYLNLPPGRRVRLQVIHDMEAPEASTTAEAVARYFARGTVKASAHYCYDNDSVVQCVKDEDVAYAAPGANHDGLHHELAGYASQTPEQWRDKFSLATLAQCAIVVSKKCEANSNQKTWLSDAELKAGKSGIVDHWAVSRVYKQSTHTDPGQHFPKDLFIDMVRAVGFLNPAPAPGGGTIIMANAISARRCPVDGGLQKLQADGGVFNTDGCTHYFGSWLEPNMAQHHAPGRDPVQIIDSYMGPNNGILSEHYAILMKDGTVFDF
jgi:hypothetical protein